MCSQQLTKRVQCSHCGRYFLVYSTPVDFICGECLLEKERRTWTWPTIQIEAEIYAKRLTKSKTML